MSKTNHHVCGGCKGTGVVNVKATIGHDPEVLLIDRDYSHPTLVIDGVVFQGTHKVDYRREAGSVYAVGPWKLTIWTSWAKLEFTTSKFTRVVA